MLVRDQAPSGVMCFLIRGAAALTACLGGIVAAGWLLGSEALVQVLPQLAPMQLNTALGFLLCGAGLLGASLGIDELFIRHDITVRPSHPGRMAPGRVRWLVPRNGMLAGTAAIRTGELARLGRAREEGIAERRRPENRVRALNARLERGVAERTAELEQRAQELERANEELERMNRLAAGRERRMIELKRQINGLRQKAAAEPKDTSR